ncbi:YoaK family protein [Thiomicrorhabdus sp.]|uniref:YoaK family protein n=1 Tax=Thiomicrorhabdus sp. TaxID=2039724 RepID=UPI0029C8C84C|nr:YoaK family protein [Thiomicrorhabdus sp.]
MPYPIRETIDEAGPSNRVIGKIYRVAFIMSLIAGYINSAMLIEFGIPVSQMSGVASHLSDHLLHQQNDLLLQTAMILFGFVFGAFLSGLLIGITPYKQTPNYGHALLLNALLLILSAWASWKMSSLTLLTTAIACGLQNALVASYRGLQLRTTHMTGNATDIGVHLALCFKYRRKWNWRSNILLILMISYVLGGILGIICFRQFPALSLLIPAAIMLILGVAYLFSYYRTPQKNIG